MRSLLLALSLLVFATSSGQTQIGAGVGVRTCAQFGKDYQADPATNEVIYNNWALGFMSGMNVVIDSMGKPRRDLSALSFEDKKAYMRRFCDQNPLKIYMDGVLDMFGTSPILQR